MPHDQTRINRRDFLKLVGTFAATSAATACAPESVPAPSPTQDDELSLQLKTVARMIKLDTGLRVATVDCGGWDTHEYEYVGHAWSVTFI
jgi:uncharacterized protein (DUF1501 family)